MYLIRKKIYGYDPKFWDRYMGLLCLPFCLQHSNSLGVQKFRSLTRDEMAS